MLNLQYVVILLPFVALFIMTLLLLKEEGFIATRKPIIYEYNAYRYCPKHKIPYEYVPKHGWFYCSHCREIVTLEEVC